MAASSSFSPIDRRPCPICNDIGVSVKTDPFQHKMEFMMLEKCGVICGTCGDDAMNAYINAVSTQSALRSMIVKSTAAMNNSKPQQFQAYQRQQYVPMFVPYTSPTTATTMKAKAEVKPQQQQQWPTPVESISSSAASSSSASVESTSAELASFSTSSSSSCSSASVESISSELAALSLSASSSSSVSVESISSELAALSLSSASSSVDTISASDKKQAKKTILVKQDLSSWRARSPLVVIDVAAAVVKKEEPSLAGDNDDNKHEQKGESIDMCYHGAKCHYMTRNGYCNFVHGRQNEEQMRIRRRDKERAATKYLEICQRYFRDDSCSDGASCDFWHGDINWTGASYGLRRRVNDAGITVPAEYPLNPDY